MFIFSSVISVPGPHLEVLWVQCLKVTPGGDQKTIECQEPNPSHLPAQHSMHSVRWIPSLNALYFLVQLCLFRWNSKKILNSKFNWKNFFYLWCVEFNSDFIFSLNEHLHIVLVPFVFQCTYNKMPIILRYIFISIYKFSVVSLIFFKLYSYHFLIMVHFKNKSCNPPPFLPVSKSFFVVFTYLLFQMAMKVTLLDSKQEILGEGLSGV